MEFRDFHPIKAPGRRARRPAAPARAGEGQDLWRTLLLEGTFEVVYEDARGAWTTRTLDARELKLGPGRTLLGGTDRAHGLYRGLRADRIRRLTEPASGTRIETGILDWLLARAEAQRKARGPRNPRRAA
ncbi:hypothetical protein [Methylobacterium sp. R2-1]|uniref:hypothetical protein n=1 Tax=Methylobacterium sp. R2-1 TaxID=2587064 RepID=UPI00160BD595|nr:hypothetical protein [Methylobacterium sp. R2-1]MBB2964116.1 putative DNA-binding transcriptional regulator YafY [Methylobacterium sp. R2-1]